MTTSFSSRMPGSRYKIQHPCTVWLVIFSHSRRRLHLKGRKRKSGSFPLILKSSSYPEEESNYSKSGVSCMRNCIKAITYNVDWQFRESYPKSSGYPKYVACRCNMLRVQMAICQLPFGLTRLLSSHGMRDWTVGRYGLYRAKEIFVISLDVTCWRHILGEEYIADFPSRKFQRKNYWIRGDGLVRLCLLPAQWLSNEITP